MENTPSLSTSSAWIIVSCNNKINKKKKEEEQELLNNPGAIVLVANGDGYGVMVMKLFVRQCGDARGSIPIGHSNSSIPLTLTSL
jgi:hypothetical protein